MAERVCIVGVGILVAFLVAGPPTLMGLLTYACAAGALLSILA